MTANTPQIITVKRLCDSRLPCPGFDNNHAPCFYISVANIQYDYARDLVYVKTGFAYFVPQNYHVEICLLPSIAKRGYILANGVQIIGSDNHKEVVLMLRWCHQGDECIDVGEKVGLGHLVKNIPTSIEEAES